MTSGSIAKFEEATCCLIITKVQSGDLNWKRGFSFRKLKEAKTTNPIRCIPLIGYFEVVEIVFLFNQKNTGGRRLYKNQ